MFDAAAQTLSLYVDGRLQDTTPAPAPWALSGHFVIGRGLFAATPIDDVRVYDQALSAADVAQLATSGTWRLDEGSGTTTADDSLEGNDGTLSTGASWTTGIVGPHAAAFDGTNGAIDTPAPVLVVPSTHEVQGLGTSSKLVLPPSSVTVLRVTGG